MDFIFYLTLLAFVVLFGTIDINIDYDFWARLIVGKSFFQTGTLFEHDFYSYGTTYDFIDHEWGSSLVFYLIQNNFGDIGLFILKTLLIFATLILIIKTIKLEKKDIKMYFFIFFFALHSISYTIFTTIRCQSFSFFFFALYLYILKRVAKNKEYRLLWCLPVLNIVWQNMHGGFVMGLALIAIFCIGEYLNNKKAPTSKYCFITFLITCLTTIINPYGFKYITYIFDAFLLSRDKIIEWQSAFFHFAFKGTLIKYKYFYFATIMLFAYSIIKSIKTLGFREYYKKIDKTKYLLLIFVTFISLKALRCHVFYTYTILALCYVDFYNIFNKKLPHKIDFAKDVLIFCLITISMLSHLYNYKFVNAIKPHLYPISCIEFIKINNLKGNVMANFHHGSYAAYRLYPNNHVFTDGRYEEVYDVTLIDQMAEFYLARGYKEFLNKFHTDIIVLDKKYGQNYPIAKTLNEDKNWLNVHETEEFALYLPSEKYKNTKFKTPSNDLKHYYKTKFETNIDWLK